MKNITAAVKAAVKYSVERENAYAKGGTFSSKSWTNPATDLIRDHGLEIVKTDNAWQVRKYRGDEIIATFERRMSARKTCLTHLDLMPKITPVYI